MSKEKQYDFTNPVQRPAAVLMRDNLNEDNIYEKLDQIYNGKKHLPYNVATPKERAEKRVRYKGPGIDINNKKWTLLEVKMSLLKVIPVGRNKELIRYRRKWAFNRYKFHKSIMDLHSSKAKHLHVADLDELQINLIRSTPLEDIHTIIKSIRG